MIMQPPFVPRLLESGRDFVKAAQGKPPDKTGWVRQP